VVDLIYFQSDGFRNIVDNETVTEAERNIHENNRTVKDSERNILMRRWKLI
jgi:hypothetical protein